MNLGREAEGGGNVVQASVGKDELLGRGGALLPLDVIRKPQAFLPGKELGEIIGAEVQLLRKRPDGEPGVETLTHQIPAADDRLVFCAGVVLFPDGQAVLLLTAMDQLLQLCRFPCRLDLLDKGVRHGKGGFRGDAALDGGSGGQGHDDDADVFHVAQLILGKHPDVFVFHVPHGLMQALEIAPPDTLQLQPLLLDRVVIEFALVQIGAEGLDLALQVRLHGTAAVPAVRGGGGQKLRLEIAIKEKVKVRVLSALHTVGAGEAHEAAGELPVFGILVRKLAGVEHGADRLVALPVPGPEELRAAALYEQPEPEDTVGGRPRFGIMIRPFAVIQAYDRDRRAAEPVAPVLAQIGEVHVVVIEDETRAVLVDLRVKIHLRDDFGVHACQLSRKDAHAVE